MYSSLGKEHVIVNLLTEKQDKSLSIQKIEDPTTNPAPNNTHSHTPSIASFDKKEFQPFTPIIKNITHPMQVISNLPQVKECEFDHQYITQLLEQLQMDPTLC